MICPNCNNDYRDNENEKSYFTQQNVHFGKKYRTFGYQCGHCNYHATIFQIPIKIPFQRTKKALKEIDNIVTQFKNEIEKQNCSTKRNKEIIEIPIRNSPLLNI